jgi:hypothetical protein
MNCRKEEAERAEFEGKFVRSIGNDRMNMEYFPSYKRKIR